MIKDYLENALTAIKNEKEQAINQAQNACLREEIAPYNSHVDELRDKAIKELTDELNDNISKLQLKFAEDKKAIVERAEQNKRANQEAAFNARTAAVCAQYDTAIAKIEDHIATLEGK